MQLRALNQKIFQSLGFPSEPLSDTAGLPALEHTVDALFAKAYELRKRASWLGWVDSCIRTHSPEYLDSPTISRKMRLQIINKLHGFNTSFGLYGHTLQALMPAIERAQKSRGQPIRILELASGSGGLAVALAREARRRGLELQITGSDINPDYVDQANRLVATQKTTGVHFVPLNAFELDALDSHSYDIVLIAQSTHHFSPGQLAKMIGGSRHAATTAFVSIDGKRGLFLLAFLPFITLFSFHRGCIHDAWITARKLYSEPELEAIARMASPTPSVSVQSRRPAYSVLTVSFGP